MTGTGSLPFPPAQDTSATFPSTRSAVWALLLLLSPQGRAGPERGQEVGGWQFVAWGSGCRERAIVEILDLSWALKSLEHHFENYLCPGPTHATRFSLACSRGGFLASIFKCSLEDSIVQPVLGELLG